VASGAIDKAKKAARNVEIDDDSLEEMLASAKKDARDHHAMINRS